MTDPAHKDLASLLSQPSLLTRTPSTATLQALATALMDWSRRTDLTAYRRALPTEERVHVLHTSASGPAAYLVSDGAETCSPPHEHQTWAVIVGIAGCEVNRLYALASPGAPASARKLRFESEQRVGPGESLVLAHTAIHSTSVLGPASTLHLHVYGQALERLPPFASRTFHAP